MKKETIIDLYYGKVNPMDMEMIEKEDYLTHTETSMRRMEELSEKLPEEFKEELQAFMDEEMKADEILHRDGFCKGFMLGLRMAAEALMD